MKTQTLNIDINPLLSKIKSFAKTGSEALFIVALGFVPLICIIAGQFTYR